MSYCRKTLGKSHSVNLPPRTLWNQCCGLKTQPGARRVCSRPRAIAHKYSERLVRNAGPVPNSSAPALKDLPVEKVRRGPATDQVNDSHAHDVYVQLLRAPAGRQPPPCWSPLRPLLLAACPPRWGRGTTEEEALDLGTPSPGSGEEGESMRATHHGSFQVRAGSRGG